MRVKETVTITWTAYRDLDPANYDMDGDDFDLETAAEIDREAYLGEPENLTFPEDYSVDVTYTEHKDEDDDN